MTDHDLSSSDEPTAPDPGPGSVADDGRPVLEPGVPDDPRARLKRALLKPSRGQLITGLLLLALGFVAITQVQARNRDDTYAGARQSDLVSLINSLSLATDRTEREITRLTKTRDSLQTDSNARHTALQLAQQQAANLALIAGTVPAVGPGIVITIQDPKGALGIEVFLNGLSELRDAGAEAIDVNGVRVVASTALSDGPDGGLMLDKIAVNSPYVIEVIGDPATLRSAVTFEGGLAFEVRNAGARLSVTKSANVQIASVAEVPTPRYAHPVPGE